MLKCLLINGSIADVTASLGFFNNEMPYVAPGLLALDGIQWSYVSMHIIVSLLVTALSSSTDFVSSSYFISAFQEIFLG